MPELVSRFSKPRGAPITIKDPKTHRMIQIDQISDNTEESRSVPSAQLSNVSSVPLREGTKFIGSHVQEASNDNGPRRTRSAIRKDDLHSQHPELTGNVNEAERGRNLVLQPIGARTDSGGSGHRPSKGSPSSSTWRFNVYAPVHVPLWLQQVNDSPAVDVLCKELEKINFAAYISTFAGSHYLQPLRPAVLPTRLVQPSPISLYSENLTRRNYYQYFEEALLIEKQASAQNLKTFNRYQTPLHIINSHYYTFWIHVPGIREDAPKVALGDVILVRILIPTPDIAERMQVWAARGSGRGHGAIAPGFTGKQFHAIVWGVDRTKERAVLRIDGNEVSVGPWQSQVCNLSFVVQPSRYIPLLRCITAINEGVRPIDHHRPSTAQVGDSNTELLHRNFLQRMLFPEVVDGVTQSGLQHDVSGDHDWIDKQLNYEQKKAVDAIVKRKYGGLPYLISGPPGTGKTKTVVETTLQLLKADDLKDVHVLVCTPSDPAADTVALRLSQQLNPSELLRLNGTSRTFAEVQDTLMVFTYHENNLFSVPPFQKLMSYKVIVTTCQDADMLVQARVTNKDLINFGQEMMQSLTGQDLPSHQFIHWKALLIDEAAQAIEPECSIPLTVVDVPFSDSQYIPSFAMAGDQHQLGPRVTNRETALQISLFERLFSRPVYKDHPASRRNITLGLSQNSGTVRAAFTNLVRNYRSHPSIIAMPSSLFYYDSLIPEAVPDHSLSSFQGWRGRRWPILFLCNGGNDDIEQDDGGWYNKREAFKALKYAQSIIASGVEQRNVCIMSPFFAQVNLLRTIFRANGLYGVNIGPLEAFQGLESQVVIVCTTRTRERFLPEDQERGLGVIFEKKRFNVAITRAKSGLFVIGNPKLLALDPTWKAFLEFCWRNGLWEPEEESGARPQSTGVPDFNVNDWQPVDSRPSSGVEELPTYLSKLERALVFAEKVGDQPEGGRRLGSGMSADENMYAAGLAAEEALRDYDGNFN